MDSSRLLDLPGELRNRIYELVLYHSEGLSIRILTGKPHIVNDGHNKHALALPSTSRQLRRESLPLVYEINKFTLIARPVGHRYDLEIWQKGLHTWLQQIGERNRVRLSHVEIDIGTSFMYDFYPTSETLWRSVSALLYLFDKEVTRVSMKTEVNWMSRSRKAFAVSIPLNDSALAQQAVREVLERQREELQSWCRAMHITPRDAGYRKVELETCGQELRSFVSLLESGSTARRH